MEAGAPRSIAYLICFSHLRWGSLYQRPQHLMTRFARDRRVFFVEDPVFDTDAAHVTVNQANGVHVVVPHLAVGTDPADQTVVLGRLFAGVVSGYAIERPLAWFYTPMALPLVDGLSTTSIVYDCMDEPAALVNAPPDISHWENALFARADVVFAGGLSLFEAKRTRHTSVHAFPSAVDVAHFARARRGVQAPADQQAIARPRVGFCGAIDERMNFTLLLEIARERPHWQFVMLGPVTRVPPHDLPRAANIHYLGLKSYEDLPAYLGGWDAAILPYALNEETRFLSPTKTPEYLAAGCPVVSTAIRDIVRQYGDAGLVEIAGTAGDFVAAIERAMTTGGRGAIERAQPLLATMSWDATFESMRALVDALQGKTAAAATPAARRSLARPIPVTT